MASGILVNIGVGNGLLPVQRQAINSSNAEFFSRGQFWPSGIVIACVCVCIGV